MALYVKGSMQSKASIFCTSAGKRRACDLCSISSDLQSTAGFTNFVKVSALAMISKILVIS